MGLIPQSEREPTVPKRGARERKIPRGLFFFVSFFSLFLIRDVVGASLRAMDEAEVSHGVKQRDAAPLSVKAFSGLWATVQ